MERSGSLELTAQWVAQDAWRAARSGPALTARQAARLEALVRHARRDSRFYAEHYRQCHRGRSVPKCSTSLPPVTKPELMARFDDWVTDPSVTRAGVEQFVADPDNLGRDFLGRYVVFTTSGSTGVPALLVQDPPRRGGDDRLSYVRALGAITPRLLARMVTRQPRQAAVFATGHFLSTTMFQRRLRTAPFRRRITVTTPCSIHCRSSSRAQCIPARFSGNVRECACGTHRGAGGRSAANLASRDHQRGELLSPAVQRRAEQAFGCLVNQSYAASEAMPLALPCRYGLLHLNSDWFVVEPIDATVGRYHPAHDRIRSW